MITAYLTQNKFFPELITVDNQHLLNTALWVDLLNPSKDEEDLVEKNIHLDVPTKEEMQEIELSSRLYAENDALFMTVMMVEKSDSPVPESDAVTLILTSNKLISVRYIEPQSFSLFTSRISKLPAENQTAITLLIELLDTSIDRLADILENVSRNLNEYSKIIFIPKLDTKNTKNINYHMLLKKIGSCGDLNTKVQESLISFNRLMTFFVKKNISTLSSDTKSRLSMLAKDTKSLRDHVIFLSDKVVFLLDATLGMVNIEQNNIIKIFSIAAVVLLPPTLIASIYGMNFEFMPELKWKFGYPLSIFLMIFAAWLPYKYFKRKEWL